MWKALVEGDKFADCPKPLVAKNEASNLLFDVSVKIPFAAKGNSRELEDIYVLSEQECSWMLVLQLVFCFLRSDVSPEVGVVGLVVRFLLLFIGRINLSEMTCWRVFIIRVRFVWLIYWAIQLVSSSSLLDKIKDTGC